MTEEEIHRMPRNSERTFVVFGLGSTLAALPVENVQSILPMADLARPPSLPGCLEGILNLASTPVPVLRLARLLQLPPQNPRLYSMLVLLRSGSARVALLVDRVHEVRRIAENEWTPVSQADSFNGCVEAIASLPGHAVHVLCPERLFLERERESLSTFQVTEALRLHDWGLEAR